MSDTEVRAFPTLEDASRPLAHALARQLCTAVAERRQATLALSGGSTPRRLYEVLATEHADLPWKHIHVFWGDERFVPCDSEDSNYRMARETLLDEVAIPDTNVHPWPTEMSDPEAAALAMQAEIERIFGCSAVGGDPPHFDVMLLGLGEDGHTASLFPNSPALRVDRRWAIPSEAPKAPRQRLTMTISVLNASRYVQFLVAGEDKRQALRCAMEEPSPDCPASLVRPEHGVITWWLDEEVAS
jgi:6-phosphogluconolactonase